MDKDFITCAKVVETFFDPEYNAHYPAAFSGARDIKKDLAEAVGHSADVRAGSLHCAHRGSPRPRMCATWRPASRTTYRPGTRQHWPRRYETSRIRPSRQSKTNWGAMSGCALPWDIPCQDWHNSSKGSSESIRSS